MNKNINNITGLRNASKSGQAPRIGVVINPLSGGNLNGLGDIRRIIDDHPQVVHCDVQTPQDVLAALDKIIRYYERQEPSSPVPLLVRGAQRLVSKSFTEIIQVLTPEAIQQIESICGLDSGSATA